MYNEKGRTIRLKHADDDDDDNNNDDHDIQKERERKRPNKMKGSGVSCSGRQERQRAACEVSSCSISEGRKDQESRGKQCRAESVETGTGHKEVT